MNEGIKWKGENNFFIFVFCEGKVLVVVDVVVLGDGFCGVVGGGCLGGIGGIFIGG